ncbi:efflux RND transporter permease subunit [Iodobacter fluviatilis]|uniref:CzcA family heavy metal efflux pump/hydrophobe/amphiphile efflux-1 (HAE1) family protein n=1 Tax=Iodobacter fluviatilis TaxID=537 RepID=A0A377SZ44_9NEIS|nr:efflux RND transporter permease subunit [Iodobacter fluviatilis]TCU82956.1 CzcA family heavy metal efflux pump/hydrophobe/amphiphile efflux-1 (HAE1) family protein [Iodobacter fluviatilis]STR45779.1 Efflux pump membrane transporter BepG [Iodobacter fluviatilis]
MWITKVSIKHPVFATMVMLALLVLGMASYGLLPVERMPPVASPQVFVQLNYPGASPEAIENDLIKPLEEQINTVNGVKHIWATAREGSAFMSVEFRMDANSANGLQEIRDKVALIKPNFPKEAKDPLVLKADISGEAEPVVQLALRSGTLSLRELSMLSEQVVVKRLRTAPGVGSINSNGLVNRQIQLRLRRDALNSYGLGVDQVMDAVREANQDVPAGRIVNGDHEQLVRLEGKIKDPKQFGKIIVARQANTPVYLEQVADVIDGEQERTSISRLDGQSVISLEIFPIQGSNIVELGDGVKAVVEKMQSSLPAGAELTIVQANSDEIKSALNHTKTTILEGGILTTLIVFMFLHSWRSTVITALTLPISVIATFVVVHACGFSLNMLTLMALSLSIGLLIDDAIVVRENIVRHLGMGKNHFQAAHDGTEEIGLAVMATTFAIVAVFVPVAFMHGIIGQFFFQFGITVTVAVLVSLFVSFTLDPMLSSIWHDPEGNRFKNWPRMGRFMAAFEHKIEYLHEIYGRFLAWSLGKRKTVLAAACVFFLSSLFLLPFIGTEFEPKQDLGLVRMQLNTPIGSSLAYTDDKVKQIEASLKSFKEIASVQTTVGVQSSKNMAEITLKLVERKKRRSQDDIEKEIRKVVGRIAGVELSVGGWKPIFITVFGPDPSKLTQITGDLMKKIAKIPGVVDLESSEKAFTPTLAIKIDNEAANDLGLNNARIGSALRALISGETISHYLASDGQNYDVVVQLAEQDRRTAADLGDLYLSSSKSNSDGSPKLVSLRQVASLEKSTSAQQLKRLDMQRRVSLYANVQGRPSGTVSGEVQALLDKTELPAGYHFGAGGQQAEMQEAFAAFVGAIGLALIFIYFVLASQFGSFLQPLAIMASLPFSLTGALLALFLTGTTINLFSMIGFMMLLGLAVKNAILLVDFANTAKREGLAVKDALLSAGQVRLRPILMTTAAMIFGMLPMSLGLGEGGETQAAMGRAIIGGVISSTVLTLIVVPILYAYLDGWAAKRKARKALKLAVVSA